MDMTPKQQLIDDRLRDRAGTSLKGFIKGNRELGWSWQDIAFELRNKTGIDVTAESIRGWAHQLGITPSTDA